MGRFNQKMIDISKDVGYKNLYTSLPGFYYKEIVRGVKNRSLVQDVNEKLFRSILRGGDHILQSWYLSQHFTNK